MNTPNNRNIKILDLAKTFRVSTRLLNAIKKDHFPYKTIGDYLDAGNIEATITLLKLKNFGNHCAKELNELITEHMHVTEDEIIFERFGLESDTTSKKLEFKNDLVKTIERKHPGMFDSLIKKYKITADSKSSKSWMFEGLISDLLDDNKQYIEILNSSLSGDKESDIKKNLKASIHEIKYAIKTYIQYINPVYIPEKESEKINNVLEVLENKYKGIFTPLATRYRKAYPSDRLTRRRLEGIVNNLLKNNAYLAEIYKQYYEGATLETIGKRIKKTRERVRQLISKYSLYNIKIDSIPYFNNIINDFITMYPSMKHLPKNKDIQQYHPKLARALLKVYLDTNGTVRNLSPKKRFEIAKKMGLDYEHEYQSFSTWTLERAIYETKMFAEELGKPDLMPLQKELEKEGRKDLRGAIAKYGGQSKVAELTGLKYQGQLVGPEGGRTYWTDKRIKKFLYEIAEKEGQSGFMPTQKACIKYAPNPNTIITNITRAALLKDTLTWYEVAKKYGLNYKKGTAQVTLPFVRSFVKSLGDALYSLTPAEIYVLFEQQGISKSYAVRTFDKITNTIQSGHLPKNEIKKWINNKKSNLIESLLDPSIETVEEAFKKARRKYARVDHIKKKDNPKDNAYRENVDQELPTPKVGDTLNSFKQISSIIENSSCDHEAIQFLISKAADKLWKRCFIDEQEALIEAKNHKGNTYSNSVRDKFIDEYTRSRQIPLPSGYQFKDLLGKYCEPKLMQWLIAYRVLKEGRVLNLSGTGTGKTLSAVLSSRIVGSQLTVIACPNATVDSWENTILTTFPNSNVVSKPKGWSPRWAKNDYPKYLILNHEMFQNSNEGKIKRFIDSCLIDFVVIDELHKVKQRSADFESQRRRLLNGLITDIPENRPKPRVLGMSATPIINNLQEGKSLIELVSSMKHDDIGTTISIENSMSIFQKFTTMGFRMMPKPRDDRKPQIHPVDCTAYLGDLLSLGMRPHPQQVEAILVKARWPIINKYLKRKTVVFTEYIKDIVPYLVELIKNSGYSVGIYTGEEKLPTEIGYKNMLDQFIRGDIDILVASIRTVGTGVDGLQHVCNNVIFATLPWTNADYEQAIGRFDREGFAFDSLDIHIPKTYATLSNGEEWSWCDSKLFRLENKRDIAKAAVDGEIPDSDSQLTPAKATSYWMGWLKRLSEDGLSQIERTEIKVPLDETDKEEVSRRYARYGEFSKLNSKWNRTHSSRTHERLMKNPEEWSFYHTRMMEQELKWQVVPREECINHLKENLPTGATVADYGCGRSQLSEALKEIHTVYSLDHIAINDTVIECDMAKSPIEDSELDAAVFSLSLMGSNIKDYILEAYRTLKPGGQLLIYHPAEHNDRKRFIDGLTDMGFAVVQDTQIYKWHYIWAIKRGRQKDTSVDISF